MLSPLGMLSVLCCSRTKARDCSPLLLCNETQRKRGLERFKTITDRDVGAKDKCYIELQVHIRNTRANPIIVPPCVHSATSDPQGPNGTLINRAINRARLTNG
jgi:hypothetical protein